MASNIQPHHLLILSQQPETYRQLIEQEMLPGLSITAFNDMNQVIKASRKYDLVFGEPSLVSKMIDRLPKLKWMQSSWAGVEPLLKPAMRSDYILTNIRNVYGPMISEYVFGYMLMIERQILPRWQSQLSEEWDERGYGTLKGKLIGLLGVGSIGARLAGTAKHFGMKVYGYTRRSETCHEVDKYFHGEKINDFVTNLDYLVCCLPGTTETKSKVDKYVLNCLPRRAWIINIGRGSTIDENALVEMLNQGRLAGAVLDVFTEEPLPKGHHLWSSPNTFITSHTAARNYPPDIVKVFVDNYIRYIHGDQLLYQVNFELGY